MQVAFTIPPGVPGSDQALVEMQVKDADGSNAGRPFVMTVYLSDSPAGNGLAAVGPSDLIHTHRPDGGDDLAVKVPRKALDVLTDATGKYILSVNDTKRGGFYVCAVAPGSGEVHVSEQLTPAHYGA